jgi:hypothetical protein
MSRVAVVAGLILFTLGISASGAQADAPLREGPFPFTFTMDDFFAGSGQSCDFPVTGSWTGTLTFTTFFYTGTDAPARIVTNVDFHGTLSNPVNGKSVPDADHHDMITDYFDPDGTFLKEVENESRDDSLLRADFHVVVNADGTVADIGRDWFTTGTVVVDIAPLCDALS